MEKAKKFQWGAAVLVVMVAACILIFAFGMMQERNRAEKELTGTRETLANTQAQLKNTGTALDASRQENAAWQQAQSQDAATIEALEDRLAETEAQLAVVQQERDDALAALQTATAERDAARTALQAMTAERDSALTSMAQATALQSQTQAELDTLNQDNTDAQAQLSEAETKTAALETELGAVTAERDNARAQLQATIEEKAVLETTVIGLMTERDSLQAELTAMTAERDGLQTELTATTAERDGLQAELTAMTAERDGLQAELTATTAERDGLQAELTAMTAERDSLQGQIQATKQPTAAQPQEGFSIPIGTWVMEPYAFRVPDYWMMQQDEAGNLHFYYNQATGVLSCVREKNEAFMDDDGILQMYFERSRQMAGVLQATDEQIQEEWYVLSGGPCMLTKYYLPGMTIYQLQYCHDGVNTFVATYTDHGSDAELAGLVMAELLNSVSYLPDAM